MAVAAPAINPFLADSEFRHRLAVDQLKWELGQPLPCPPPPPEWPLLPPRPYYYYNYYYGYDHYPYYYQYYYGCPPPPAGDRLDSYIYSRGFRDGVSSATSRASTPTSSSGQLQKASRPKGDVRDGEGEQKKACSPGAGKGGAASSYPGDLMEFPSGSYRRRETGCMPVSTATSYDDLTMGWPYGCKPFYFRRADPPTARYF